VRDLYDLTVVGGGPAGLYTAFYSGLRNMKTKIIEFQSQLGGKVLLYPEKMIWDVGGQPPTLGERFVKQLIEQGLTFDPTVCLGTKVEHIERDELGHFILITNDGERHYTKSVVMANGGGIINPMRLELEGAEKFEMTNLHYTVQSLNRFRDKTVLISGGGNAAVDWAVELLPIAKKVIVIYRKDTLSAHEAQVEQLKHSDADLLLNTTIETLVSNMEKTAIEEVVLQVEHTGGKVAIKVDEVLINHGYDRDISLEFSTDLKPELVDDYYYKGDSTGSTSQPGIFAAGDILSFNGKVNLLVGAFQDAVNAVNQAKQYIDPKADKFGMVSSHNETFVERNRKMISKLLDQESPDCQQSCAANQSKALNI